MLLDDYILWKGAFNWFCMYTGEWTVLRLPSPAISIDCCLVNDVVQKKMNNYHIYHLLNELEKMFDQNFFTKFIGCLPTSNC